MKEGKVRERQSLHFVTSYEQSSKKKANCNDIHQPVNLTFSIIHSVYNKSIFLKFRKKLIPVYLFIYHYLFKIFLKYILKLIFFRYLYLS